MFEPLPPPTALSRMRVVAARSSSPASDSAMVLANLIERYDYVSKCKRGC